MYKKVCHGSHENARNECEALGDPPCVLRHKAYDNPTTRIGHYWNKRGECPALKGTTFLKKLLLLEPVRDYQHENAEYGKFPGE
jgi:hypothetical protein